MSEEPENACKIVKRFIDEEALAQGDYVVLKERLTLEGKMSPTLEALLDKIQDDELSHRTALQKIIGVVCEGQ